MIRNATRTALAAATLILAAAAPPAPACPCDWDNNGVLNQDDMDLFKAAWINRDPSCDFNLSGRLEVQDLFDFECCLNAGSTGTLCGSPPNQVFASYPTCPSGANPRVHLSPGDFNGDGRKTPQDIFEFLAAYFANAPAGDFNRDGRFTVQDIFDFLAAYFTPFP